MMKSPYEKNYTALGYRMSYHKEQTFSFMKNQVLQFRIEMLEISPVIWRRIQVPVTYNFWDLHVAIQDAMGWKDYHLHHFEIKGKHKQKETHIGIPDFDYISETQEIYPGWEIPVLPYFNDLGVRALYLYDYGDYWQHDVKLEGYIYREKGIKYPVCTGGERACPPEDCGSVSGYHSVIDILADRDHEEHEEMRIWAGEDWHPDHFNPGEVKFDNPFKRWKGAFLEE